MILSPHVILLICFGLFCFAVMVACCWTGATPAGGQARPSWQVNSGLIARVALAILCLTAIGWYVVFWQSWECVTIGGTWVQGGRC